MNITTNQDRKRQAGQNLVEFALVLPLLLLVLALLLDAAALFYTQMVVSNAAFVGARAGATLVNVEQGDQEIRGAVEKSAFGLDSQRISILISPAQDEYPRSADFPAPRGEPLEVTVTFPLRLTLPGIIIPVTGKSLSIMEYSNP